jgi:hypothetical protein
MTDAILLENFKKLPKPIRAQMEDYLHFLVEKYGKIESEFDFSAEEWAEMVANADEVIADSSKGISLETFKANNNARQPAF